MTLYAISEGELEAILTDPEHDRVEAILEGPRPPETPWTNIDKAWQGIHYLLTGTAQGGKPPLNALHGGGIELPDPYDERGYGPPIVLSAAETDVFARALDVLSDDELRSRFDPGDVMKKRSTPRSGIGTRRAKTRSAT